ncbi:MAG: tetratricopeptide repeat protein [Polyangiaceae bacterium]
MKRHENPGTATFAEALPMAPRIESGVRGRVTLTNLAHPPTRFFGRRREMSELRTLLVEHPLVTVLGPPGIGKTRLATELARLLLDEFGDEGGAWRIDLADATDADSVAAAVTRTLALGAATGARSATASVGASLGARGKTLLILDAADGCVGALARALSEWMGAAPDIRFIVTSRARINVEGEAVLDLGPLGQGGGAASDGVSLFLERARAARPDLPLDERTSRDVLELVRRLDGVPLAIELAAARTRTLTPAQMLEQESSRFDLLGATAHHADPRHTSLRSAIDTSWELLDEWQKGALAQLSVFAGGFDVDAAEAVIDLTPYSGGHRGIDALEALRDRSLLSASASADDGGRLRFSLYGSVREYARERLLMQGGREAAVLRHGRHYVAAGLRWAELYDEGKAREATVWLTRETENLLAAHRRTLLRGHEGAELALQAALALDPMLAAEGPATLRLALLDAGLTAGEREDVGIDLRVRALEARADANRLLGRGQDAVADAQAALKLATSSGARATVGRVLRGLAVLALMQGKLADGRGLLERACTIDRETHQRREEGRALGLLGSVAALEGHLDLAWSTLERAIAVHREVGDLRFEVTNTGNLAVVAHDAGRLSEARVHCDRALALCRQAGNRRLEAEVLGLLAAVAHEEDRLEEAGDLYGRALSMHREVGNRRAEGTLLSYHGALLAEVGDVEGSRAAYARALNILRECRDRPNEALVLGALAAIEAREGCLESARAALSHATECLEGVDEPRARAAVHLWRGHLELALSREARLEGEDARAQMLVDDARRRLDETDPTRGGEVRRAADVRLARRSLSRAIEAIGRADSMPSSAFLEGPPPNAPADALVVCANGRWFRTPHGGVVSIARWRPLQRLLERLAERREIAPGEPLPVEALVAAGWPGERMLPKAGATRVYTAIASLRRIGLRDMLVRDERGYSLRTDVPIARVSGR